MMSCKVFLYIVAWSVYWMQGGFIPRGAFFTKIICFVLLLISLYHLIFVNFKFFLPRYFIGLNVLLGLFSFYGVLALMGVTSHPLPEEYLKTILISFLPIYSFYFYTKKGLIKSENLNIYIVLFFLFAFLKYYGNIYSKILLSVSGVADFTNNAGYLFLPLIATCVFFNKKIPQYITLCICLIIAIESSKRGVMVVCFICLFWFLNNSLRGSNVKTKIAVVLFFVALFFVGYVTYERHLLKSYAFQNKMHDLRYGDGSGRGGLYMVFLSHFWDNTNAFQFVFGLGANATLSISSHYAHNDWFEIAVNQGLLGLGIYFLYFCLFFRECVSQGYNSKDRLALQFIFIICFMKTFFSMSYGDMTTATCFVLGYCLAKENKNEEKNTKNLLAFKIQ